MVKVARSPRGGSKQGVGDQGGPLRASAGERHRWIDTSCRESGYLWRGKWGREGGREVGGREERGREREREGSTLGAFFNHFSLYFLSVSQ